MSDNDTTSTIAGSIREAVDQTGPRAEGLRHSAERAVESRRKAAADGLASAAERLRDKAEEFPGGERMAHLAHGTADRIEATADFLRDHDTKDMVHGVQNFVRKHPGKSLAVAAVVGFLAARALRED